MLKTPTAPRLLHEVMAFIEGVPQVLPPGSHVGVQGVEYGPEALVAKLEEVLKPVKDVVNAEDAAKVARREIQAQYEPTRQFLTAFVAALRGYLGANNPKLATLGIKPARPATPLSVTAKLQRALKAKATRKARGTLGRRQRKAIKAESFPLVVIDDAGLHPRANQPLRAPRPATGAERLLSLLETRRGPLQR